MVTREKTRGWQETSPPKRKRKPVKLRYRDSLGKVHRGSFVWCEIENTWVQCTNDPDGIALYKEDGFEVLGWKG